MRGRGHHLVLVHGGIDESSTGGNCKLHSKTKIVGGNLTSLDDGSRTCNFYGKDLSAVSLATCTNCLLANVLQLGRRQFQVKEVFTGKKDGSFKIVLVGDGVLQCNG